MAGRPPPQFLMPALHLRLGCVGRLRQLARGACAGAVGPRQRQACCGFGLVGFPVPALVWETVSVSHRRPVQPCGSVKEHAAHSPSAPCMYKMEADVALLSGGHMSRLKCSCTLWARAREADFAVRLT